MRRRAASRGQPRPGLQVHVAGRAKRPQRCVEDLQQVAHPRIRGPARDPSHAHCRAQRLQRRENVHDARGCHFVQRHLAQPVQRLRENLAAALDVCPARAGVLGRRDAWHLGEPHGVIERRAFRAGLEHRRLPIGRGGPSAAGAAGDHRQQPDGGEPPGGGYPRREARCPCLPVHLPSSRHPAQALLTLHPVLPGEQV